MRLILLAAAAALVACDGSRQAVGTVDSVIVVATDSLWSQVGDSIITALEPRIFTVREERAYDVTHIAPDDPNWAELRQFRQVVSIGTAADTWLAPVLDKAGAGSPQRGVIQAQDVWARNQFATAMVLPSGDDAAVALELTTQLTAVIDSAFRIYAQRRMYTSGPDTILRDSLRTAAGYSILLPNVYGPVPDVEGALLYQNATQIGGDLVRSVLVATRDGLVEPTAGAALEWRDSLARTLYRPPHVTERERTLEQPVGTAAGAALEVQGVWTGTDPSWPASGPFITRMIQCPSQDRTYLVDTWLFAPSRGKYEYMIQLRTILDTFECGER